MACWKIIEPIVQVGGHPFRAFFALYPARKATLGVKPPAIAKSETVKNHPKRSTLKPYVTAPGGELARDVTLPDGQRIALTR